MARLFDDGASEYLASGNAVVSVPPFVFACWFYSDDGTATTQTLMSISSNNASFNYHQLIAEGFGGVRTLLARTKSGNPRTAQASSSWTANKWHHACGIWPTASDRWSLLDGVSKGTDANDETPVNIIDTSIGGKSTGAAATNYFSGRITEAAIWDLSDWFGQTAAAKGDLFESFALPALAAGYSPAFFPLGLVAYWKLLRDEDKDYVGGYHMTAFNTPSIAPHPPKIIYPSPAFMVAVPSAAAPGVTIPVFMHHYRQQGIA